MSYEYDSYFREHVSNVKKAADWLIYHFPDLLGTVDEAKLRCHLSMHDDSKASPEEYDAYDAYFYGGNRSHKVVSDFNYA